MKIHVAAALVLSLLPTLAFAQDTGRAPIKPSNPVPSLAFANAGRFKSTDGVTGTYRETEVFFDLNRSSSRTIIFTRATDKATRTETTTDTLNADGTRMVTFTATDYGATSSFTSNTTVTVLGRGQSVGQGIYTTADGVTGTLTTLDTTSPGVEVLSTTYRSPAAGISAEQRTQIAAGAGKVTVKTVGVDPTGTAASVIQTRTPVNSLDGFQLIGS